MENSFAKKKLKINQNEVKEKAKNKKKWKKIWKNVKINILEMKIYNLIPKCITMYVIKKENNYN